MMSIQSHGFLLGLKQQESKSIIVLLASENISTFRWVCNLYCSDHDEGKTKCHANDLLNKDISFGFESIFVTSITEIIRKHFAMDNANNFYSSVASKSTARRGATFCLEDQMLCMSFVGCVTSAMLLVEIEVLKPRLEIGTFLLSKSDLAINSINRFNQSISVESVVQIVCDLVLTDYGDCFDTAIALKFLDDYSTQIIECRTTKFEHTSTAGGIFPVGQRIPETAIPKETRELLLKNGFRIIYDVNGVDSNVSRSTDDPLDLNVLSISSVSQCYLVYLRRIGVQSSLTISIVVNGALWGLYVFHSHIAGVAKVTFEQRALLESVVSASANRIAHIESDMGSKRKENIIRIAACLPDVNSADDFLRIYHSEILSNLDCDSIIVYRKVNDSESSNLVRPQVSAGEGLEPVVEKNERANKCYSPVTTVIYGDQTVAITEAGYQKLAQHMDYKLNTALALSEFSDGTDSTGLPVAIIIFKMSETSSLAFVRRQRTLGSAWLTDYFLYQSKVSPFDPHQEFSEDSYRSNLIPSSLRCVQSWSALDIELCQHIFHQFSQALHLETVAKYRLSSLISDAKYNIATENATRNSEFFSHMSHELRSPFHGIISSLQILKNGAYSIDEQERMYIIEGALECSESMLSTLDAILTIAKNNRCVHTREKDLMRSDTFDLLNLVVTISRRMKPIADNKSVKFEQLYGELVVSVDSKTTIQVASVEEFKSFTQAAIGDEIWVTQIASNLVGNAIKFTSAGGSVVLMVSFVFASRVESLWREHAASYEHSYVATNDVKNDVHADRQSVNCPWLVIEVRDTGFGVEPISMPKMFNAYQQVSSGVRSTYQGTGLGLHIVRMHTQAMNGILGVASTAGIGTLMFCAFPLLLQRRQPGALADTCTKFGTGVEMSFSRSSSIKGREVTQEHASKKACIGIEDRFRDATSISNTSNPTESTTTYLVAGQNSSKTSSTSSEKSCGSDSKDSKKPEKAIFLVVDDSETNVRLLVKKITMAFDDSVECFTASDGNVGVEVYKTLLREGNIKRLAGIFMDYHMPNCNGIDAIAQIRSIEKFIGLRPSYIVGFTADLADTSSQRFQSIGANQVIPKPSPAGQLEETCGRLIQSLLTHA